MGVFKRNDLLSMLIIKALLSFLLMIVDSIIFAKEILSNFIQYFIA